MEKKSKIITYVAIIIILIMLLFLAFVTKISNSVPGITVYGESGVTAEAILGGYTWNSFFKGSSAENVDISKLNYSNKNILLVKPGEKITLRNSGKDFDVYKFDNEYIKFFDDKENNHIIEIESISQKMELKSVSFYAPQEDGSYIFEIGIDYNKYGTAQYGIKMIVSSIPSYSVDSLLKYRGTYIGNAPRVNQLLSALPYKEYRDGIVLRTANEPYELIVYYKNIDIQKEDLLNNTVAIFALVDNVDVITYELDSKSFVYTRKELETVYGRALTEYANNTELWKREVLYNLKDESNNSNLLVYNSIFNLILKKISSEYIAIDIDSFNKIPISENEKRMLLKELLKSGKTVIEANNAEIRQLDKFKGCMIYAENITSSDNGYVVEIIKYDTEKKQEKIVYNISKEGIIE